MLAAERPVVALRHHNEWKVCAQQRAREGPGHYQTVKLDVTGRRGAGGPHHAREWRTCRVRGHLSKLNPGGMCARDCDGQDTSEREQREARTEHDRTEYVHAATAAD